jgi:hypothetical protein
MLKGSCLCGGVKYEIDGALGAVTNCHCSLCRKMSGSAFSSGSTIPTASVRLVSGAELLKEWESSPGYHRVFCGRSPIIKRKDKDLEASSFSSGNSRQRSGGESIEAHSPDRRRPGWRSMTDCRSQDERSRQVKVFSG